MRVEQSRMVNAPNSQVMIAVIDGWLEESARENDPIFFSDLLTNWEQTFSLVKALMEEELNYPIYKLFVMCDEWGQKVMPGDKVSRKFKRPLFRDGLPITSQERNDWKVQGIYDKKRYRYKYYDVDEKGCITVTPRDAEYFLRIWGVHSISNMRLSVSHVIPKSIDKAKDPVDGKMKHVHYWRYKEMDKTMYEALPVIEKEPESKPEYNQNKGYQKK